MRPLLCILAAALLVGCGDETSISDGGRVGGDTLTVYSLLERTEASRQFELGEKLALQQAGGRAGDFTVNYATHSLPAEREAIAHATRDVVLDQGVIAVIGSDDEQAARVTVPLLDAAGVLHLLPGVPAEGFANPSGRQTFAEAPAGERTPGFDTAFRAAFPAREPTTAAADGWAAMRGVLAAIDDAGGRARSRRAVIEAYMSATKSGGQAP